MSKGLSFLSRVCEGCKITKRAWAQVNRCDDFTVFDDMLRFLGCCQMFRRFLSV